MFELPYFTFERPPFVMPPPMMTGTSSTVSTLSRTPSAPSLTAVTFAEAMYGSARTTRASSGSHSSEQRWSTCARRNARMRLSCVVPDWKSTCCMNRRTADGSRPTIAGGCDSISMPVIVLPSQWNCVESGDCAWTDPAENIAAAASARITPGRNAHGYFCLAGIFGGADLARGREC